VGTHQYLVYAERECQRYVEQLTRQSPPPAGANLLITYNPHDFGTYLDVVADFDPEDGEQSDWAFSLEVNLPANWDPSEADASEAPDDIA
jgi:hypothetical protein